MQFFVAHSQYVKDVSSLLPAQNPGKGFTQREVGLAATWD